MYIQCMLITRMNVLCVAHQSEEDWLLKDLHFPSATEINIL
jgi:hypothetical protein